MTNEKTRLYKYTATVLHEDGECEDYVFEAIDDEHAMREITGDVEGEVLELKKGDFAGYLESNNFN